MRLGALAALLIAMQIAMAGPTLAHAVLLETVPADGAVVARSPSSLVLRFNEAVTPIAARVLDSAGRAVTPETWEADGAVVRVPLPTPLAAGTYIASYRVISADAHPVGASIVFAVGEPVAAIARGTQDGAREAAWRIAAIADRVLRDAALLFAAGGAAFAVLVLGNVPPRLATGLRLAASIAVGATVAGIGITGGFAAAAPPDGILSPSIWGIGWRSTAGPAAVLGIVGLAIVALAAPGRRPIARVALMAGAIAALCGPALTGHAAAGPWRFVQALQMGHNLVAAFWVGSFWPLLLMVRSEDAGVTVRAARRFAAIAGPAVVVLVGSGVLMAASHVETPGALISSTYGRLVLLKVSIVAVLLAVAAVNRWKLTVALAAGTERARGAFARNLRLDLALGLAVLTATGVLVHTPPPHDEAHHQGLADRGTFVAAEVSGNRRMTMFVTPAAAGRNLIEIALATTENAVVSAREVRIELSLPVARVEAIVRRAVQVAPGRFRVEGPELALPGYWQVRVEALIDDFERAVFETEVIVD